MKLKGIELKGTYKIIYYATSFDIYNEKDQLIIKIEVDSL